MPQNDIAVDEEVGHFGNSDKPPPYDNTSNPLRSPFTAARLSDNTPTTWYGDYIPVLATIAVFTTIMGIAESVCYAVYYFPFRLLLPIRAIFVPIIGGGPTQIILVTLAFICSRNHHRSMMALCAFILTIAILCGLAIPAASFALNEAASSDTTAVVEALQQAPSSVLNAYAAEYQSCTYNVPVNDTINSVIDIVPQYLDKSCRYAAIICNVPIQSCIYTYKAYSCVDLTQTQSIQGPCNTLARVAYQVSYDWNKIGKTVDAWTMGVWGFWFIVFVIFCARVYLAGL